MTIPEIAAQIAVEIANDDSHGYSQANRWGPDYDCSSLVIHCYDEAFREAGMTETPKSLGATYTGNMQAAFLGCGFEQLAGGTPPDLLMVGDVLLNFQSHTCIYIGDGKVVNARTNSDGMQGDSRGDEIRIQSYWYFPWDVVLRYSKDNPMFAELSNPTHSNAHPNAQGDALEDGNLCQNGTSSIGQTLADKIQAKASWWPTLKMGDVGDWVTVLQAILKAKGYNLGTYGVDGDFGVFTYSAVTKFQRDFGLELRDGVCGKDTWEVLRK